MTNRRAKLQIGNILLLRRQKKKAAKNKTSENWQKYKVARNKVNDGIKCAKPSYYDNYFRETVGNIRESWKGVNMVLEKNFHHTEINNIKIENVTYFSSIEISNVLNNHFK